MLKIRLSVLALTLVGFTATFLAGCSSTNNDQTAGWSPEKIYSEARDEVNAGAWDRAAMLFDKLESRAAGTPLAQQAQIEKAYAQYRASEKIQAIATIDRFIKLHPTSPAIDYALYLKGLVNFNDNLGLMSSVAEQDLAERDPKQAKESFEAFRELVNRFPSSKYAEDARLRMSFIKNSLARSDVHVARFYYQRGAYVAAINRAQTTVQEFRDVPAVEEALFIMVQSYDKLGLTQLRDDTKRVLETTYPNTAFLYPERAATKKSWWKFWK